jgi:hypothetical protein
MKRLFAILGLGFASLLSGCMGCGTYSVSQAEYVPAPAYCPPPSPFPVYCPPPFMYYSRPAVVVYPRYHGHYYRRHGHWHR